MYDISRMFLVLVGSSCLLAACASMQPPQHGELSSSTRLKLAEAADAAGDRDLASSMYIAAAKSDPTDLGLQLRSVEALAQSGKVAEARTLLQDRLRANPRQPALLRALALVDLVSGEAGQAITIFDQLLEASPGDVRLLVDKAVALDVQHRHSDAQRLYRQALEMSPGDPAIRNDLAMSLMLAGRIQEARDILLQLNDMDGVPQRVRVNLAIAAAAAGDMEQSRQLLQGRARNEDLQKIQQALRQVADISAPLAPGQQLARASAKP